MPEENVKKENKTLSKIADFTKDFIPATKKQTVGTVAISLVAGGIGVLIGNIGKKKKLVTAETVTK